MSGRNLTSVWTPMAELQNARSREMQKKHSNAVDLRNKVNPQALNFLSWWVELKAVACFPQSSAPGQQFTSCRNFLKDKQLDDIRVSGENIINSKQQWKQQHGNSQMFRLLWFSFLFLHLDCFKLAKMK